jgi:ABC-2 type transport system permease protein
MNTFARAEESHAGAGMAVALPAAGPAWWLRSYGLMVRWEFMSLRLVMPLMIVVQILIGAGTVIGLGFLIQEITRTQALYLATGGSVVALLMIGLVLAPQLVAQKKFQKTYDYMLSLPVPRPVLALAGVTVWMLVALPGMALALGAAAWWYGLDLKLSFMLLPAALLTVLAGCSIGVAVAHALPQPSLTTLITQVLSFAILFFSPINFPQERLPEWLQAAHAYLPFQHAAIVMRGALTEGLVDSTSGSFLVLSIWTAAAWAVTLWVLSRRR